MTSANSGSESPSTKEMLNKIIEGKVGTNRRYVDEVLQKIQDENHRYYLEKFVIELQRMDLEEAAGNLLLAFHHKVMADTYRSLLEKTF